MDEVNRTSYYHFSSSIEFIEVYNLFKNTISSINSIDVISSPSMTQTILTIINQITLWQGKTQTTHYNQFPFYFTTVKDLLTEILENSPSPSSLSSTILLSVNLICDFVKSDKPCSVVNLAQKVSLPRFLVDVRHDATHHFIPSVDILLFSAIELLKYLFKTFWTPFYQVFQGRILIQDILFQNKEIVLKNIKFAILFGKLNALLHFEFPFTNFLLELKKLSFLDVDFIQELEKHFQKLLDFKSKSLRQIIQPLLSRIFLESFELKKYSEFRNFEAVFLTFCDFFPCFHHQIFSDIFSCSLNKNSTDLLKYILSERFLGFLGKQNTNIFLVYPTLESRMFKLFENPSGKNQKLLFVLLPLIWKEKSEKKLSQVIDLIEVKQDTAKLKGTYSIDENTISLLKQTFPVKENKRKLDDPKTEKRKPKSIQNNDSSKKVKIDSTFPHDYLFTVKLIDLQEKLKADRNHE
eukprot:snap_masked-scaffold_27-processed-gene-2.36-mRNA-1 protein AED:1.00 eAED:1.00 QI:0/0/0/0/1/1/2/0/464